MMMMMKKRNPDKEVFCLGSFCLGSAVDYDNDDKILMVNDHDVDNDVQSPTEL